jgi:hypothetical protein
MTQRAFRTQVVDQRLRLGHDFIVHLALAEQLPPTRSHFFLGKQGRPHSNWKWNRHRSSFYSVRRASQAWLCWKKLLRSRQKQFATFLSPWREMNAVHAREDRSQVQMGDVSSQVSFMKCGCCGWTGRELPSAVPCSVRPQSLASPRGLTACQLGLPQTTVRTGRIVTVDARNVPMVK